MTGLELLAAVLVDLVLGDPRCLPHPVRGMGWMIQRIERMVRTSVRSPQGERWAGICLAAGLSAGWLIAGWVAITLAGGVHALAGAAVTVYLGYTTLAVRDLIRHAGAVQQRLEAKELDEARCAVAHLVGRDTATLSESEVVRAAVESVAESTCDGIVAPLFYLALGGPPLALAYKAINTLDSMIGHLSPEYRHFGWASARLDDMANWVPARLTGLLLVAAAFIRGCAGREAWRILRRDATKHPSPNSGWPESAMAGALRVQLGGRNVYEGIASERPRLGDPLWPLAPFHIGIALDLTVSATALAVVCGVLIKTL